MKIIRLISNILVIITSFITMYVMFAMLIGIEKDNLIYDIMAVIFLFNPILSIVNCSLNLNREENNNG